VRFLGVAMAWLTLRAELRQRWRAMAGLALPPSEGDLEGCGRRPPLPVTVIAEGIGRYGLEIVRRFENSPVPVFAASEGRQEPR